MRDLVLLSAMLGGPAYGYALKRTAGLIFGDGAMHNNVVYPLLKKFVASGWVRQRVVPGDRGQQRKQYRLTAAGRKHLLGSLAALGENEAADEGAFLLRVAFFDVLSRKNRAAIVAARRSFLTLRSQELARLREGVQPRSFALLALDRVRQRLAGELRWIREIEKLGETATGGSDAGR
jgi:DNA-binding PadR family transcriptional regulator